MAAVAARSCLRSATTSTRSAAARFFAGAKPKASTSPFRPSSQGPPRVFRLYKRISVSIPTRITFLRFIYMSIYVCTRSPVEMRSISAASMLPYHTATASALLTSMLSVSPRSHAWTPEGTLISKYTYMKLFVCTSLLS